MEPRSRSKSLNAVPSAPLPSYSKAAFDIQAQPSRPAAPPVAFPTRVLRTPLCTPISVIPYPISFPDEDHTADPSCQLTPSCPRNHTLLSKHLQKTPSLTHLLHLFRLDIQRTLLRRHGRHGRSDPRLTSPLLARP